MDRLKLDGPFAWSDERAEQGPVLSRLGRGRTRSLGLPVVKPEPVLQLQLEGTPRLSPGPVAIRRRVGIDRGEPRYLRPTRLEAAPALGDVPSVERAVDVPGQHFASATEVELHPSPDVVAIGPPAPDPPPPASRLGPARRSFSASAKGRARSRSSWTAQVAWSIGIPGSSRTRRRLAAGLADVVPGDDCQPVDLQSGARGGGPGHPRRTASTRSPS